MLSTPAHKFIYKSANWVKYRECVDIGIDRCIVNNCLKTTADIEFEIVYIANVMQKARNQSVPIATSYRKYNKNWLNLYKNDKLWSQMLQELGNGNITRKHLERIIEVNPDKPVQHVHSKYVSNDRNQDIAYQFADVFQQAHETTSSWTHRMDSEVKNVLNNTDLTSYSNPSFVVKCDDVQRIIDSMKPLKSPGPDGITNMLIKNLPQSAIIKLTEIFNACITLNYWPSYFKSAKVIPILKDGKDATDAQSYRPISLINSIGKLFENLVKEEIETFLTKHQIIPPQQFGFRKKHSTMMQIKRITCFIAENRNVKQKPTGLVKLDVEKASESVWHDGLIYKLIKYNFPPTLVKLINSFIRDREFMVFVNGGKSKKMKMPAGLAQGTVLNPLLFTIFLSDIPIPKDVELAMYADDIAVFTAHHNMDDIINDLNKSLSVIRDYFFQWKIKVNIDKLQAIIFPTRQRQQELPTADILYDNSIVRLEKSVKYLGVTLDQMLTFEDHIHAIKVKAIKCCIKFSPLLQQNFDISTKTKRLLYFLIIRPILAHGSPLYSRASPSAIEGLYLLQNKLLRIIFNLPNKYPDELVASQYDVPHLKLYFERVNKRFAKKCMESFLVLIKNIDQTLFDANNEIIIRQKPLKGER